MTRNLILPLVQKSSTPKTDRFEGDRHAHRIILIFIEIELLPSSSSVASVVRFSILSPAGHLALRVLSSRKIFAKNAQASEVVGFATTPYHF